MENSNVVFKSDLEKEGQKLSSDFKNLTCSNYEAQELKGDSSDYLNKFYMRKLWGGTDKEVVLGIRNDEVTGKNTLVRLNLNTVPQKEEAWDIKENIDFLSAAVFLKQYDDFTREQESKQEYKNEKSEDMETLNAVFKSDVRKDGFEENNLHKNLTCLNHEVQELKGDMFDDLNKFRRIKQEGEPGKEVIIALKNDEVTGKNSIVRISMGTNPQEVESWEIKENILTLDAAVFLKQYDAFTREQENKQEYSDQIELAKKMGYVQGVCECVAAIGDDHTLGKKLLSEMNITKDTAKKFANPETYKALENGIFAQKIEQKFEQTHSIKR